MSNDNSGRDKLLEEILSSVGKGKDNGGTSRAERAAASSANRAASEKRSATSSFQKASYGRAPEQAYGRNASVKFESADTDTRYNFSASSEDSSERAESASSAPRARASDSSIKISSPEEITGSINRLIDAFDTSSGSSSYKSEQRQPRNTKSGRPQRASERTSSTQRPQRASERTSSTQRPQRAPERTSSTPRPQRTPERTSSTPRPQRPAERTSSTERPRTPDRTAKVSGNNSRNSSGRQEQRTPPRNVSRGGEAAMEMRRAAPRKKRRLSGRLPVVLIVTTIIFTIAISLSILIISVGRDMLAIGKTGDIKIVTIPEGVNTEEVAQILFDEGIIKMPKAFIMISRLGNMESKYIAGDHELSPSNAYETIIDELTTDKSLNRETVDITFIEGCNIISAAKQLEEANVCEAERFIYYFNAGDYGYEFENYLPTSSTSKFNRMEGYLFPDTYSFYVDTDPEVVCQKIYKNFNEKFKAEYYTKMKQMNMTLDEVVTLASIVQAESPDVKTMKKVASVFENRLASPEEYPKLQSDPTTYYVDEVIRPNIEIPSEAIFEAYDTYKCNGLPPGAIGNPGTDAIEAVLYPEKTDYYFFYANIDTMETLFAKTDEEHEANKKKVISQQTGNDENDEDDEDFE